jgi:general secretion pathway protein I
MRKDRRAARARGFTLLEVMVAVAILGLGLTAILAAQAGAFASSAHARNVSVAVGLLRCKMSEVEEDLAREGFQELDKNESGPCCDDQDSPGMTCTWRVDKPALPEPKYGELDLDSQLDPGSLGALGLLSGGGDIGSSALAQEGGSLESVAQSLGASEAAGSAKGGGMAGLAGMAMSMVYPDLKTVFEASVRKVTVTIAWREGARDHAIDLSQWVANPQNAQLTGPIPGDDGTDPPVLR